jgi:DNA-directed RNA polymerase subunit RPC12/RpoP
MKCAVCGKNIETTFLNKIVGTMVRIDGKKHYVCSECQKKLRTREEIERAIKW